MFNINLSLYYKKNYRPISLKKSNKEPYGFGFENFENKADFLYIPEIIPLKEHFDTILVKQSSLYFDIICIKYIDRTILFDKSIKETSEDVLNNCKEYTGKMNYKKIPPIMQIIFCTKSIFLYHKRILAYEQRKINRKLEYFGGNNYWTI